MFTHKDVLDSDGNLVSRYELDYEFDIDLVDNQTMDSVQNADYELSSILTNDISIMNLVEKEIHSVPVYIFENDGDETEFDFEPEDNDELLSMTVVALPDWCTFDFVFVHQDKKYFLFQIKANNVVYWFKLCPEDFDDILYGYHLFLTNKEDFLKWSKANKEDL